MPLFCSVRSFLFCFLGFGGSSFLCACLFVLGFIYGEREVQDTQWAELTVLSLQFVLYLNVKLLEVLKYWNKATSMRLVVISEPSAMQSDEVRHCRQSLELQQSWTAQPAATELHAAPSHWAANWAAKATLLEDGYQHPKQLKFKSDHIYLIHSY